MPADGRRGSGSGEGGGQGGRLRPARATGTTRDASSSWRRTRSTPCPTSAVRPRGVPGWRSRCRQSPAPAAASVGSLDSIPSTAPATAPSWRRSPRSWSGRWAGRFWPTVPWGAGATPPCASRHGGAPGWHGTAVSRPSSVPRRHGSVLVADVAACYASIEPRVLARRLRSAGAAGSAAEEIERFLHDLGERGVEGLPVGPSSSALLANLVLAAADEARSGRGTSPHPVGRRRRDLHVGASGDGPRPRCVPPGPRRGRVCARTWARPRSSTIRSRSAACARGDPVDLVWAARAMMRRREDPLSRLARADVDLPPDRGVGADRRPSHPAGGDGRPSRGRPDGGAPGGDDRPGVHRHARAPHAPRAWRSITRTCRRRLPSESCSRSPVPVAAAPRAPSPFVASTRRAWDRPDHPTLAELDAAGGDVPLAIVRADGHLALANSAAIAASGVAAETTASNETTRGRPPGG